MAKLIIDIDDDLLNGDIRDIEYAEALDNAISRGVLLPANATNGDIIKAMFPNIDKYKNTLLKDGRKNVLFGDDWWNTPYEVTK